jgi:hypothetical protein
MSTNYRVMWCFPVYTGNVLEMRTLVYAPHCTKEYADALCERQTNCAMQRPVHPDNLQPGQSHFHEPDKFWVEEVK